MDLSVEIHHLKAFRNGVVFSGNSPDDADFALPDINVSGKGAEVVILVRGVLDDGRILNIAGDYIAHGIRHRASELMTLELGPQTEVELQNKLRHEVDAERLTRLDRMMIAEQREHGVLDLRPDAGESYLVRTNRLVLIDRVKRLERFGVAEEIEPGRWTIAERAESTLRAIGEREDILRTIHRALADHGLADERGATQYVTHGSRISHALVGRVIDKGLAGDEMGERFYLVIDGDTLAGIDLGLMGWMAPLPRSRAKIAASPQRCR